MVRPRAACSILGASIILACARAEPADLTPFTGDGGPPNGFEACRSRFFGAYLTQCSTSDECGGVLRCDLTKTFSVTPRCHVQLCEDDSQCETAFKDMCVGTDFHYECTQINPNIPTECRIVEGPKP